MKREFIIKNTHRQVPKAPEPYQPEYQRLNLEPQSEVVDPNEMRSAINMQTLSSLSRRVQTPIVTEEQRLLANRMRLPPQPVEQKSIPSPKEPVAFIQQQQEVKKHHFTSTRDIMAEDVFVPPDINQAVQQYHQKTSSAPQEEPLEVSSTESLQQIKDGEYCLVVGDQLLVVESKEEAMGIVALILEGDDPAFAEYDLNDLVLLKRLPIKFGFHTEE